jgi:hypothetical protein
MQNNEIKHGLMGLVAGGAIALAVIGFAGCQSCEKPKQGNNFIDEEHQRAYERYQEVR